MTKPSLPRRIAVYSHDTFGLGNIRRMLAISKALVDADDETSLLIISGSPMLHAFRIQPRMDYVKLPCLSRNTDGEYGAKSLRVEYDELLRLRGSIIKSTLRHFDPDVFLVDKKPLGVGHELEMAFEDASARGRKMRSALLLRDILDAPDVTRAVWIKNDYQAALRKYYDSIMVVGSRDVFDVPREYGFCNNTRQMTEFCGYIAREPGHRSREEVRQAFGISKEPLVLVTAGGGEDGYRLLSTYLNALETMSARPAFRSLILCGPEMPAAHRTLINERAARRADVFVEEFSNDVMSYMNAAELVVSMGGYNTVCEILTLRKRAIVVPRVKPVQEQIIRAERLSSLGLLTCIHPDELSPQRLIDDVQSELLKASAQVRALRTLDMNGLSHIVERLSAMVDRTASFRQAL